METDVELQETATGFQDYNFFFFFDISFIISKQSGKVVLLFEAQIWNVLKPSLSDMLFRVS